MSIVRTGRRIGIRRLMGFAREGIWSTAQVRSVEELEGLAEAMRGGETKG